MGRINWGELFPGRWSPVIFISYIALCINQGILVTWSQRSGHYEYNIVAIVLMTEVLKLVISTALYCKDNSILMLLQETRKNKKVLLLYMIPVLLYCVYNNLAFVNLARFDPTTYYVLLQLRVVLTGIIVQVIFSKKLSATQWFSIVILTVGCMVKHFDAHVLGTEFHTTCSCLAGVYNEYLLKRQGADIDIFIQNVFMYIDSIFCNIVAIVLLSAFTNGVNETLTNVEIGSYQRSIGQNFLFPIAQSTMSGYVAMVTHLICRHLGQRWIVFPTDRRVIEEKKRTFLQSFRFPGTIGAIDGTHIALITPAEEEHNYLNRKGFHSKNVQIICDADLNILNVNPRHAGATHDSYIWRNSAILEHLRNNYEHGDTDTWLIGDSGYPQQPWLMTPIVNAQPNTPESRYTDALVKARCCVERCIGTLKSRFRCILKERMLRYSPLSVGRIIVACSVLHNICNSGRLDVLNDIHPEGVQENNVQENMQKKIWQVASRPDKD